MKGASCKLLIGVKPFRALPVGDHTLYFRYLDQNGVASQVFSKKFKVDPIAITFQQPPADFATGARTAQFTVGVLGANETEAWTINYSVDAVTLDQKTTAVAMTAITAHNLTVGEHKLYVQAVQTDGKQTPLIEFPFSIK
ncbi:MAG: hypothetical protein HZB51_09555 [Chloroflexi bacterium]|nr:hypothetical protein [Chloroflexota bacterium]